MFDSVLLVRERFSASATTPPSAAPRDLRFRVGVVEGPGPARAHGRPRVSASGKKTSAGAAARQRFSPYVFLAGEDDDGPRVLRLQQLLDGFVVILQLGVVGDFQRLGDADSTF